MRESVTSEHDISAGHSTSGESLAHTISLSHSHECHSEDDHHSYYAILFPWFIVMIGVAV